MPLSPGYNRFKARAKLQLERIFKDYRSAPLTAILSPTLLASPYPHSAPENAALGALTEGRMGATGFGHSSSPVIVLPIADPNSEPQVASWVALKSFTKALNNTIDTISSYKLLKDALLELIELLELCKNTMNDKKSFVGLPSELEVLFEDLEHIFTWDTLPVATASVMSLCRSIQQDINAARRKALSDERTQNGAIDQGERSLIEYLLQIEVHLQRISLNVNLRTWGIIEDRVTETSLASLRPSKSCLYNSTTFKREGCAAHTSEDILASMHYWAHSTGAAPVFWLTGLAGTGKTTIAYSLCTQLAETWTLAASFFCSVALPECRDASLIIPSIAYQLAQFSRPFQIALTRILENFPNSSQCQPLVQFETFISKPLFEVQSTLPKNLVVVIDALDECEDQRAISQFVDVLLDRGREQPIKFLVTSRPKPGIRDRIMKHEGRILQELDHVTVQMDIERYLRTSLAHMDLSTVDIDTLVEHCGALFIYAATVVRYIDNGSFRHDAHIRLQRVLNLSSSDDQEGYRKLDELYRTILHTAFENANSGVKEDIKLVLGAVVCAQEPLTLASLSEFFGLDANRLRGALGMTFPVLHISRPDQTVIVLHASFPDFILDFTRSGVFHCDSKARNRALAERAFYCMKHNLRFNICELESSFSLDWNVKDLEKRVNKAISPELLYACRHWAAHTSLAGSSKGLAQLLEDFLSTRLLLWMEVMNLKREIYKTIGIMQLAEEWDLVSLLGHTVVTYALIAIQKHLHSSRVTDLVRDARRFVKMFATGSVAQSTPHIYISMLSIWPRETPLSRLYAQQATQLIRLEGTAWTKQHSILLATWCMGETITATGLSPDGTLVAVGVGRDIYILDAYTGRPKIDRMAGHAGHISSLAFSPDGSRIISGSHDNTIRTWESCTGQSISKPARGHAYAVTSVAFSPNGTFIASGSRDKTICIWDAMKGDLRHGPLFGHTDSITSVQFSPDTKCLLSGSHDGCIRVWDVTNGELILGPLKTSSPALAPVAFSSDGSFIVSASQNDIRLWDARTGNIIGNPLRGHNGPITAIATSPDGATIVSGSEDHNIFLWDTVTGKQIAGPFIGHTKAVNSVAFFPDGRLIISSSSDNTIRIWDSQIENLAPNSREAHTEPINCITTSSDGRHVAYCSANTISLWYSEGEPKISSLKGHTAPVLSVCFSPDGACVVSGSADKTLRIWDATSGESASVLHGHTDSVTSIAFSIDGTRIISGSNDATLQQWDARNGIKTAPRLEGHEGPVTSVAISPDGTRIVSASRDKTIKVWDALTQELISDIRGHSGAITTVAFSPRGQQIASGSEDKTIRIWDSSGHNALGPFEGHNGAVIAVCFSPDGTRIISGSTDRTLRMWDISSGALVFEPLKGHTRAIRSVRFSPDGTQIYSSSDDGTIQITNAEVDKPSMSEPDSTFATLQWSANRDGWVVDDQSRLLIWIPPELVPALMSPRTIRLISPGGYLRPDFKNASIGKSWINCEPVEDISVSRF
ncbi:unnamed protein product [Rhizoctonia solani]|uniref:Nephrocystin 3-like N-terminal domain-containing protein n=1 Tax=Rhizoctonia solani TaxID=456999 RepID=A0A8H3GUY5_9AGAM|nr:unnamed protein product [Rhizoctonia solani]